MDSRERDLGSASTVAPFQRGRRGDTADQNIRRTMCRRHAIHSATTFPSHRLPLAGIAAHSQLHCLHGSHCLAQPMVTFGGAELAWAMKTTQLLRTCYNTLDRIYDPRPPERTAQRAPIFQLKLTTTM